MTLQVLSRQAHKGLHLRAPREAWAFARERMIAGLVAPELAEAIRSMPVAFSILEGRANIVALMGLGGRNLFIGSQGQWLGQYIPAVLRAWPFALVKQGEQRVVGIDVDSEAVSETEGEPLFGADGEPSDRLQKTIKFLQSFSDQELVMARAVAAIQKANLLVPWEFTARQGDGTPVNITGLYQVDRAAYEALSDEAFLELRREGALPVIYAHVFSQRNTAQLEQLARRQADNATSAETPELPQALYITDDYLKF